MEAVNARCPDLSISCPEFTTTRLSCERTGLNQSITVGICKPVFVIVTIAIGLFGLHHAQ